MFCINIKPDPKLIETGEIYVMTPVHFELVLLANIVLNIVIDIAFTIVKVFISRKVIGTIVFGNTVTLFRHLYSLLGRNEV